MRPFTLELLLSVAVLTGCGPAKHPNGVESSDDASRTRQSAKVPERTSQAEGYDPLSDQIVESLSSPRKLVEIPREAWERATEETALEIVLAWKRAGQRTHEVMLSNAWQAAANSGLMLREQDPNAPFAERERLREFLDGMFDRHRASIRDAVRLHASLDVCVKQLGAAAAPALLVVGETKRFQDLGAAALSYLEKSARNSNSLTFVDCNVYLSARYPLKDYPPLSTAQLLALLENQNYQQWERVIRLLAGRPEDSRRIVSQLIAVSADRNLNAKLSPALASIRADEHRCIQWIMNQCRVTGLRWPNARREHFRALAAFALTERDALAAFEQLTQANPEFFVLPSSGRTYDIRRAMAGMRHDLAEAISKIGPAAAPLIPLLKQWLNDPPPKDPEHAVDLRRDAAIALGGMGPPAASILKQALADGHPEAIFGLSLLSPTGKMEVDDIRAVFQRNERRRLRRSLRWVSMSRVWKGH